MSPPSNTIPSDEEIEKISPTTFSIFAYEGTNVVETVNSTVGVVARYTQTDNVDEPPLAMQRGSTASFYETDGLGSITSLTDSTGALAQTYSYDSYGNLTNSTGSITNPIRYTGREFDAETSLYYYRARYYDPTTGRFLSEDKLRFGSGGVHFYSYVDNNPNNFRDPSGRKKFHGNWCGPDWTGAMKEEYNPAHASSYAKPVDDLDTVCMHHDICYFNCRNTLPCDPEGRSKCMRQCDNVMTGEALPIIVNQNWGYGYAIWWAIKLHKYPDPGTNIHCGCYNVTRLL